MSNLLKKIGNFFKNLWAKIVPFVKKVWAKVLPILKSIGKFFGKLFKKFKKIEGLNAFAGAMLAIAIGLIMGILLMWIIKPDNATEGITRLIKGTLNNPNGVKAGIGVLLLTSAPLILTGLSVAFAFKTGLFNIGASGQYTVGLFCAVLVGILGDSLGEFQWIVAVLAGMAGGFLWGAIPGLFKARYNVHEVITSIMFNYVGMYLVNGLLTSNFLKTRVVDGSNNRTIKVDQLARTPYGFFDELFPNSGLDISILIAIGTAILIYFLLNKTVFGRELKAVGLNRHAAKYSGVNEKKGIFMSMAISGMLAGLGGALFILGPNRFNLGNAYAIENVILTPGFDGIPIALLASSNPIGVVFATFFVSHIKLAGTAMQSVGFVKEIVDIIIAIILYFSAFSLILTQNLGNIKKLFRKFKRKKETQEIAFEAKEGDE